MDVQYKTLKDCLLGLKKKKSLPDECLDISYLVRLSPVPDAQWVPSYVYSPNKYFMACGSTGWHWRGRGCGINLHTVQIAFRKTLISGLNQEDPWDQHLQKYKKYRLLKGMRSTSIYATPWGWWSRKEPLLGCNPAVTTWHPPLPHTCAGTSPAGTLPANANCFSEARSVVFQGWPWNRGTGS